MTRASEISAAIREWSSELEEALNSLSYLGSQQTVDRFGGSDGQVLLDQLCRSEGASVAASSWVSVLREGVRLSAPALLLVLEHLRLHPAEAAAGLRLHGLGYAKTLANVAYRTADALHEDAKAAVASAEIDVAIARFRIAISEFRFSIESHLLSDPTRRIATGKYATAIAMSGRWVNLPPDTVSRALRFSQESMQLGNVQPESLVYRLELLLQQFDLTGDVQLLLDARRLPIDNPEIASGSEVAQAEIRLRLARLSASKDDAQTYLALALRQLGSSNPRNSSEDARRIAITTLTEEALEERLSLPARSVSIPRGLVTLMATEPSKELWATVRLMVQNLEIARTRRSSLPAAALSAQFLRRMVDGPAELLEQTDLLNYVEITGWLAERSGGNRHLQWEAGAAALSTAKRTGNKDLALRALERFEALAIQHPGWPLPKIGIARVRDYLYGGSVDFARSSANSWREAAVLALDSAVYGRAQLGGRNEVFAVADARGLLSETFVFKRTTKAKAEHEASMLEALRSEISRRGLANRFEVPRSLAIVELPVDDDRRWVHVSQRAAGQLISELAQTDASRVLESIVDLLAIFHSTAGSAPPGKSAWRSLKDYLKMWTRTLFEQSAADKCVEDLRTLFPAQLPLVRKRDGHASNWLLDPAGRIVAIDLESSDFVPVGLDLAQLIEDNALVSADASGWTVRLSLMERYLSELGITLSPADMASSYSWFAICRALRLGTEREAGKQLKRHARELCGLVAERGDDAIRPLAREVLLALSRVELSESMEAAPSHDHRRLSKSMAYMLRHHGPTSGVPVDPSGFADMDDLATALRVDSSQLLAVAEHPGEPRFEIREGRIRALYGHSLNVNIDTGIDVGVPSALYHGSSWSALDAIVANGLVPMGRNMVHLTNRSDEALEVGRRKGSPLVLVVDPPGEAEPVAEGIWVATGVPPKRLAVVNPFRAESGTEL